MTGRAALVGALSGAAWLGATVAITGPHGLYGPGAPGGIGLLAACGVPLLMLAGRIARGAGARARAGALPLPVGRALGAVGVALALLSGGALAGLGGAGSLAWLAWFSVPGALTSFVVAFALGIVAPGTAPNARMGRWVSLALAGMAGYAVAPAVLLLGNILNPPVTTPPSQAMGVGLAAIFLVIFGGLVVVTLLICALVCGALGGIVGYVATAESSIGAVGSEA